MISPELKSLLVQYLHCLVNKILSSNLIRRILQLFTWRDNCSDVMRADMYEWRRSQIARAVLTYLRSFPEAQDTIGGIGEWWLPHQRIRSHPTLLKKALNELVAKGFVLQHKGKDSQIHYRINRRVSR